MCYIKFKVIGNVTDIVTGKVLETLYKCITVWKASAAENVDTEGGYNYETEETCSTFTGGSYGGRHTGRVFFQTIRDRAIPAGEASEGTRSGEPVSADGKGQIYYLNFKPEVADVWVELAEKYTAETGIPMKVQTAAAGTYEQTLKSEVAKKEPPTLFQINGPIGYKSWAKYCRDLSDTEIYGTDR